jgi:hypothetical protein
MSIPFKSYNDLTENQELWFLSVAYDDLHRAMQAAGFAATYPLYAQGDGNDALYGALHDAAIVRYMRPFCGCNLPDERRKVALPASIAFGNEEIPEIHRHAKELRHQVIAHSDMQVRDVRATRLPNGAAGERWQVETSGAIFGPPQMPLFLAHCEAVRNRVHARVQPMMHQRMAGLAVGQQLNLRELVQGAPAQDVR